MTSINSELIIDPKIFRENISLLKNKLNNSSKFMAVIKSDAYGHHLEHIVKDIEDLSDGFGVVRIDEALKIRELSNKKILLMQGVYSKEDLDISIQNKFDLVVHNLDQFQILKEGNHYEGLWFKLNTGMNRLGFGIDEFLKIYEEYLADDSLKRVGKKLRFQFEVIKNLNKKITPKEIINSRKQFRSSLIVRNIYSEVLNIIQPIVIKKLKSNKNTQSKILLNDALLTSIAGISAAMKNTG